MAIIFWTLLVWGIAFAHVIAFLPTHVATFGSRCSTSSSSSCYTSRSGSQLWASNKKKPSRDSFDSDEPRERLDAETNPYAYLFPQDSLSESSNYENDFVAPEKVHCIFFQPGTAEQGMHTVEQPAGSGNNVVLAFEIRQACDNFANRLRDLKFFDPTPHEVDLGSLEFFCKTLGVSVQVVPAGVDLIPPSKRVETLGHKNPAIRRQQNELADVFAMLSAQEEGVLVGEYGSSWD